jgi:DNA end-binding protein Ku
MAARSLASVTLSFGLVNIPVKVYSATEASATVKFNLLAKDGARLKQQYVSERDGRVVERADMVKGYEFEKDRFVIFTADELKALDEAASHVIEIVSFVPEKSVEPTFYDKPYLLAPDKRGGKAYALLMAAMQESGRCALARWNWKGKQYVVQVRSNEDGLILQQLLYAEEVRSLKDLDIEKVDVSAAELQLALQLIDQIAKDAYDPGEFHDNEKKRVLAAIDNKIAGKQIVATEPQESAVTGQVIDLMDALRASLGKKPGQPEKPSAVVKMATAAAGLQAELLKERKPARRSAKAAEPEAAPVPARARK